MNEDEKLEWYNIVCDLFDEIPNHMIMDVVLYYWADEIYLNMSWNTQQFCKGK